MSIYILEKGIKNSHSYKIHRVFEAFFDHSSPGTERNTLVKLQDHCEGQAGVDLKLGYFLYQKGRIGTQGDQNDYFFTFHLTSKVLS